MLVPFGCKYVDLVDMIMSEMKIDKRVSCLQIEYIADVEMSPIRITSDSALKFYLELKRRDHLMTAYALRVSVSEVEDCTAATDALTIVIVQQQLMLCTILYECICSRYLVVYVLVFRTWCIPQSEVSNVFHVALYFYLASYVM